MDTKVLSTGVQYSNLPESYIRPESDRPRLSEVSACDDVPVIDLGLKDRSQVVKQIAEACKSYGFFQVTNHGVSLEAVEKMLQVATEFFSLPVEEKLKLYSDDPSKTMRLSTSFNVKKEKVHNWRDYLRLHCYPLDKYVPEWPSNPPDFKEIVSNYCMEVRQLGYRLEELISESLGLEKDCVKNVLGEQGQHMAVNYYPPCPEPELTYGLPGHTDPNALTILLQDLHVAGLQVLKDGKWVAAMMLRTLISALLILCSYSLHGLAQPGGCPRCPLISAPARPRPPVYPRPRPPLYPPGLHLMPRRPANNPGPLSNRARILFITQELKRNITYDPQNYTGTWVGNNYCLFKGFFCDTVPDLNITGLARITFNGARFGGTFLNFYRFIRNLPDIAIFHANSNNFSGVINRNINQLRYLYELDLSNNRFLGRFPSNVLGATNLTFVDLRFNTYVGVIPPQVFNIDTNVLFINNNRFIQKIPATLGNTPALYLTLANNKFTGEIPRSIGRTWNTLLEVLFLNNRLNGCLPFEIGYLQKSTVFDVGGNLLTGPIPQSFGCLFKMELLNLAHNQFYGTIPESLCRLPNAYNFSLSYNFFTQVGPVCRRLIRAKRLDVRRNCITGLPQQKSAAECTRFFARPRSCPRESTFSVVPCRLTTTGESLEEEEFEVIPTIDEMTPPSPTTYGALTKPHH